MHLESVDTEHADNTGCEVFIINIRLVNDFKTSIMNETLSLRAYKPEKQTHVHEYHQVVVPVQGAIAISLNEFYQTVTTGHCVAIARGVRHSFTANSSARFLVADLSEMSDLGPFLEHPFTPISHAFRSFCYFSELQLKTKADSELERCMIDVFKHLLLAQNFQPQVDRRITTALTQIESDISSFHTLQSLAKVSSLSVSQFKVLFTKHTGMSLGKYLLVARMERARILLINTDTPMSSIAEQSGYSDLSAFSRRFRSYFGVSPSRFRNTRQH